MSSSSTRSKLSPHIPRSALDSPENEGFSDDSGVDLRPQGRCSEQISTTYVGESRRNKRKSSEPRRRKDVLQMKRFQWESDEDDGDADGERELVSDSDDVFEDGERPSSGDSGFQSGPPGRQTVSLTNKVERPSKQDWRKPRGRQVAATHQGAKPHSSTLRQSVIQKHDSILRPSTSSTTSSPEYHHSSAVGLIAVASGSSSSLSDHLQQTSDIVTYDDLEGGQGTTTSTTPRSSLSRSSGRPRNYKSMSRQRRIEANARERSRVHTISAAFESLRRAVPAYAHNQKLSKLAILRIASAYIVALACLNQQHSSKEVTDPSLEDCVDQCTRTIQAEGRTRRRPKE